MEDVPILLTKHKDKVVAAIVVIIFLFISKNVYDVQIRQYKKVKEEIMAEGEKASTLDRLVRINEQLKKLKVRGWPTTDFNVIAEEISNYALETKVKILDIVPQEKRDNPTYISIPCSINAEADYRSIYLFIKKLETSLRLFQVRSINLDSLGSAKTSGRTSRAAEPLRINMVIEALYLK